MDYFSEPANNEAHCQPWWIDNKSFGADDCINWNRALNACPYLRDLVNDMLQRSEGVSSRLRCGTIDYVLFESNGAIRQKYARDGCMYYIEENTRDGNVYMVPLRHMPNTNEFSVFDYKEGANSTIYYRNLRIAEILSTYCWCMYYERSIIALWTLGQPQVVIYDCGSYDYDGRHKLDIDGFCIAWSDHLRLKNFKDFLLGDPVLYLLMCTSDQFCAEETCAPFASEFV